METPRVAGAPHSNFDVLAQFRAGIPLKAAQSLARHSDPKLTLNVYAHLSLADERAALEKAFGPAGREQRAAQKSARTA